MAAIVPHRFLVRVGHTCPYVKNLLQTDKGESLVAVPDSGLINNYSELDDRENFATLKLAWNELGLGLVCTVDGKKKPPVGDAERPRSSDGLNFWIDTRDARTSHRASRYCHQFHFLPAGGGGDKDEPVVRMNKINRALADAPLVSPESIPFRCQLNKNGYEIQAFVPVAALTGFDPEQFPRLGIYTAVRDQELGDQYLTVNQDFPFADDPSLWQILELVK